MHCIKVRKQRSKFFYYGYFTETDSNFVLLTIPHYKVKIQVKTRDVFFALKNNTEFVIPLLDRPEKPTVRAKKKNHNDIANSADDYTAYEMQKFNLSHYRR